MLWVDKPACTFKVEERTGIKVKTGLQPPFPAPLN